MKQFSIKLNDRNYSMLKEVSIENNISIGKIINFIIEKYMQESKPSKKNKNKDFDQNLNKSIQIKLTQSEYNRLKNLQKLHLHSSISQEARYHIVNSIESTKFLSNIELNSLALCRAEIHKIGVNFNQFMRVIHTRENMNIPNTLSTDITKLLEKVSELKQQINKLVDKK